MIRGLQRPAGFSGDAKKLQRLFFPAFAIRLDYSCFDTDNCRFAFTECVGDRCKTKNLPTFFGRSRELHGDYVAATMLRLKDFSRRMID